jgi:hypothetical protein
MNRQHNKKRNIGIVYEQLLRYITEKVVQGDKPAAQKALSIIERRFNPNTEIYKEFRLFKALVKTTVSDTPVAAAILTEAKSAARRLNSDRLDIEKSSLIKEINYTIGADLYSRKIDEYKDFATIQTLINDWQMVDTADLSRVVQYESKIVEKLIEKKQAVKTLDEQRTPEVDNLVVKIMTEKINSKWNDKLSNEQREILRTYAFYTDESSREKLKEGLGKVQKSAISALLEFKRSNTNPVLMEKVDNVIGAVREINLNEITDDTIARFLTISQMKSEIMTGGEDE